jgi:hypothetical protein
MYQSYLPYHSQQNIMRNEIAIFAIYLGCGVVNDCAKQRAERGPELEGS